MAVSKQPEKRPVVGAATSTMHIPAPIHIVFAVWIVAMLLLALIVPDQYEAMLEEDRAVEWATVWLFAAAAVMHLRNGISNRMLFTVLVGLFCLFVAGEEFSWGQRLLGFGSPEYFLANNYQQELNLHNLPGAVVKPKWVFIIALAGFGLLLPLVARSKSSKSLIDKVGIEAPPVSMSVWFGASILLLLWYPATLTGEWVECLAGALFLASARMKPRTLWILLAVSPLFGIAMTGLSGAVERGRDVGRTACAQAEVQAVLNDLTHGAMRSRLRKKSSVHKRMWSAINEKYVDRKDLDEYDNVKCAEEASDPSTARRTYFVDPWGVSYWIYAKRGDDGSRRLVVYSFGPNRRRDGQTGYPEGDDVAAIGVVTAGSGSGEP